MTALSSSLADMMEDVEILRLVRAAPGGYVHRPEWRTAYDDTVLAAIYETKGAAYLCDELAREEDPSYVRPHLEATISAHVDPGSIRRLLDFGCGCGSSTMILSRFLPRAEITGVELEPGHIKAARARARFYGANVEFLQSPAGDRLPAGLGSFDAIMLPAVYEHLLPAERRTLLPMLWEHLEPGGVLFIDETPWRWFPVETHTTGLPFINYLPDGLAERYARLARRIDKGLTWQELLRMGIRGATPREIAAGLGGEYIEPRDGPVRLWAQGYAHGGLKKAAVPVLNLFHRLTGLAVIPYLSLAIRKPASS